MRRAWIIIVLACTTMPLLAQEKAEGPANEKAQKTYNQAIQYIKQHNSDAALDCFKKADKQDGGRCLACQQNIVKYGIELGDWKAAEAAAAEIVAESQGPKDVAIAHHQLGMILMREGLDKHKGEYFTRAHDEMTQALASVANFPDAVFADGLALAQMNQDAAAKAQFDRFVRMTPAADPNRQRALRYISQPELARARMAPPFNLTTMDGQHISLDDMNGKVVLIDFWAIWCAPCREALPHIKKIAGKFQGQPLVILSVSLDEDELKWKDFTSKNGMTWLNYRDGGFTGPIGMLFGVHAIPHTFTIDANGVLQDEQIGDASIEGKLKKLLALATERQAAESQAQIGSVANSEKQNP